MKKLQLIHQEQGEECFEILKSTIDKNTMLKNLPERVVNEFLNFLGTDKQHRDLMLHLIKSGSLVLTCEDEE